MARTMLEERWLDACEHADTASLELDAAHTEEHAGRDDSARTHAALASAHAQLAAALAAIVTAGVARP